MAGTLVIDASSVDTKNQRRDDHLRGSDFFETDAYPTFTYIVSGARPAADNQLLLAGTLTVHGESHQLDVPVTVAGSGPDRILVAGEVDIDRRAWGLTWGAKMGAGLVNHVTIVAAFTRS